MLLQAGEANRSQISDPRSQMLKSAPLGFEAGWNGLQPGSQIPDLKSQISNAQIYGIRIEDGII
jgi:hypothetical protein